MATKRETPTVISDASVPVEQGKGNVFADLGLPDADDLRFKAELTRQIYRRIKEFGLTQVAAGKRLGLKQPDVSRLMQGKFTGFSTDRLLTLLMNLQVDVEIILRPRTRAKKYSGSVRVLAEVA